MGTYRDDPGGPKAGLLPIYLGSGIFTLLGSRFAKNVKTWSFGKDQKLYVTVGQIERLKLFFLVGFLFKVRYKNIFSQFYRITTLAMGIFKK